MTRRLLLLTSFVLLFVLGCNFSTPPVATEPETYEHTGPLTEHRLTDPFTVKERIFSSHPFGTDANSLVQKHNEEVNHFVRQPGLGLQREIFPRDTMRLTTSWSEFVLVQPASESNMSIPISSSDYMSGLITLANQQTLHATTRQWQLNQHHLVSLTQSAVYTVSHESRHEAMKAGQLNSNTAAKRPLDDFELLALERLKNGVDAVSRESGNTLRVFGGIKARKDCLGCHQQNKEGDLLGAFTYKLNLLSTQTPEKYTLKNLAGLSEEQVAAIRQIEAKSGRFTRAEDGTFSKLSVNIHPDEQEKSLGSHGFNVSNSTSVHFWRNHELAQLDLFPDLQELDIGGSLITDAGLEHLKPLTQLMQLNITNTQITQAGLDGFRKTHPGCTIVGKPFDPKAVPLP
jgi:hypothetical protein